MVLPLDTLSLRAIVSDCRFRKIRDGIKTALQISLFHVKGVTEVLEVEKRIEVAAAVLTLVDKIHLVPTLEICVEQMRIVCRIYELGVVAAVEHADDELHQLGVKARVYLVNQQELASPDDVHHALHHAEQRLCALRLLSLKVKGDIGIAAMVGFQGTRFHTYVNDIAVGSSQYVKQAPFLLFEQFFYRHSLWCMIIQHHIIAEESEHLFGNVPVHLACT